MPKDNIWYSCQPMGRQKLGTVVSEMARAMKFEGKVTNHSLRAMAASGMHQNNLDKQLVMERTGHHSTSVRGYKRTSSNEN